MSNQLGNLPEGTPALQGEKGEKGEKGDRGPKGESVLVGTAELMVSRLVKADRRRAWQVRLLAVVGSVSLTAGILAGIGYFQNRASSNGLRQQSITNCENNNKFRAAQVSTWEKNYTLQAQESKSTGTLLTQLIFTLASGDPAKIKQIDTILAKSGTASQAEITTFLNFVKSVDAPKNCQALYG